MRKLLPLGLSLLACNVPELSSRDLHGSKRVSLSGDITDGVTNHRIADASVYDGDTGARLAKSDENGLYVIPSIAAGVLHLQILADRYQPRHLDVDLTSEVSGQDIELVRSACTYSHPPDGGLGGGSLAPYPCYDDEFCDNGQCRSRFRAATIFGYVRETCRGEPVSFFRWNLGSTITEQSSAGRDGGLTIREKNVYDPVTFTVIAEKEDPTTITVVPEATFTATNVLLYPVHLPDGGRDCSLADQDAGCADGTQRDWNGWCVPLPDVLQFPGDIPNCNPDGGSSGAICKSAVAQALSPDHFSQPDGGLLNRLHRPL